MKLSDAQRRTLAVVWVTYGTFYFCRVNVGPARSDIQHALGVGALEMGFVLGALKLGYALGQFVSGQLAEKIGPKRVVLTGMVGSGIACLLFAASPEIASLGIVSAVTAPMARGLSAVTGSPIGPMAALLIVIWMLNGFAQAGGWPPCVEVMARWFSPKERGRTMGILGTSYQLGSALTIFACGWLVSRPWASWRIVFLVPAAGLFLSAIHTAKRLDPSPSTTATATATATVEKRSVLLLTLSNPKLWLLALGLFGLDLVRFGFLDWAPTHLKEVHGSSVATAALQAAVFPLSGALGALTSGWLTDRYFQSRRAPVIAMLLALVGVFTLSYDYLVAWGAFPTVVCLAAIGFCVFGAQVLLVGTAAQDFAKGGAAAAAAGFVDFTGSMGAFAGDVVTGSMVKHGDWHGAIHVWAAAAVVAAVLVSMLWRAKAEASVGPGIECGAR
jgi:sugar phosphate permease